MTALGSKMNEGIKLASIQELETLWYELQREINASGEVVKLLNILSNVTTMLLKTRISALL